MLTTGQPCSNKLAAEETLHIGMHTARVCYRDNNTHRKENFSFPGASAVKNLPANAGDTAEAGLIPGREDPPQKEMATHSSILAWKTLRIEEPGRLQSMG